MHPILFTFPEWLPVLAGRSVHVYGVMVAFGFLLGMLYIQYQSKRVGLDAEKMMDLAFGIILMGLLGSRILYIINEQTEAFLKDPLLFFRVWEGGLVFQGGVILCIAYTLWYCRRHSYSFFKVSDVFSPALALGHALGRIGCFFAGCCYGRPAPENFPFSLIFPAVDKGVAPPGIPLYPTQLTESLGEFLIFGFLIWFGRRKPFDGAVFLLYLILYAILRSTVEIFRGDTARGFIIEPYLSVAQSISLVAIACSIGLWFYLARRQSRGDMRD